jgi:hypothetical protein
MNGILQTRMIKSMLILVSERRVSLFENLTEMNWGKYGHFKG